MARRLTFEGARILACVEIMPYSSGLTRNVVQCLQDFDIPLLLSHTVVDIQGDERLTGVTIAAVDPKTLQPIPGSEQNLVCDTLLLSVGLIPENELSRQAGVTLSDITQGPLVDQTMATGIPGVFACGNVLHVHDLVDEVSAEASRAGEAAMRWLTAQNGQKAVATDVVIPIVDGPGVRGVVPQFFRRPAQNSAAAGQPLHLMFRPDAVYRRSIVHIDIDGRSVAHFNKLCSRPAKWHLSTWTRNCCRTGRSARYRRPGGGESMKELICIGCPMGCMLQVETDGQAVRSVKGNVCKRGSDYARDEVPAAPPDGHQPDPG